jgi:hypothetical protein
MFLIGRKVAKEALADADSAIDKLILPLGFKAIKEHQWRRMSAWRIDEIDLVVKGEIRVVVLPSFRVILRRPAPSILNKQWEYVANANVARILRPNSGPDFEKVVPQFSLFKSQFVNALVSDIAAALPWFKQFATPVLCIENLSNFLKVGCPAYVDAIAFLRGLPAPNQ